MINILLNKNKNFLEEQVTSVLQAESADIRGFRNLPFFNVSAVGVEIIVDEKTSLTVDSIKVRYNLIKWMLHGIGSVATKIELGDVVLNTSLPTITKYAKNFQIPEQKNRARISEFTTEIIVNSLSSHMNVLGQISSDIEINNSRIVIGGNSLSCDSSVFINMNLSNTINYIKTGVEAHIELSDLSNGDGTASAMISGVNFGGIPVFQDEYVNIAISNGQYLTFTEASLSNIIVSSNDRININIERPFVMSYEPYEEFQLMEHILDNGDYLFNVQAEIDSVSGMFDFFTSVVDSENEELIWAKGWKKRDKFYLQGYLETEKYGVADIDISFREDAVFPEGSVYLKDIAFADGLKFGGDAVCTSASNILSARATEFRINGGNLKTVELDLLFDKAENKLIFEAPSGYEWGKYDAKIEGVIVDETVELHIEGTKLPGTAIVSNISVNFFDINKGYFDVTMDLFSYSKNDLVIDAEFTGFLYGYEYINGELGFSNDVLSIPGVSFYYTDMFAAADFYFNKVDAIEMIITIDGYAVWKGNAVLPVYGTIDAFNDTKRAEVKFNIDDDIYLKVFANRNSATIYVDAHPYSLDELGFPGSLDVAFELGVSGNTVTSLFTDAYYTYNDELNARVLLDTELEDEILEVNEFLIDLKDDTLSGTGTLWQTPNHINGKIEFARGGSVKFETTGEEINAMFDIKNVYYQDFLRDELDVFISTKMNLYGSLASPDFYGNVLVENSFNSDRFLFSAPDISRSGDNIYVNGVSLTYLSHYIYLDSWLKMTGNDMLVTAGGWASLFDSISSDFSMMYQKKSEQSSFTYRLSSLSLKDIFIGDFQGGMFYEDGVYGFYRNTGKYGLSGDIIVSGDNKEWDLELFSEHITGTFFGDIIDSQISSSLAVNSDLSLLSVTGDLFTEIGGSMKLSLIMDGNADSPDMNGDIRFYDTTMAFGVIENEINNAQFSIPVYDSKLVMSNFVLPTSEGNWVIKGYADLAGLDLSYLDVVITSENDAETPIVFNIDDPALTLDGKVFIGEARLFGAPPDLKLTGTVYAKNLLISIGVVSALSATGGASPLDDMYFNLDIVTKSGVRFMNSLVDATIEQGQTLTLLGGIGDNTFTLSGELSVSRGTFVYVGRDFKIEEGNAVFSGKSGDPIPYIYLSTSSKDISLSGEKIDIYLTFEGKLNTISIKDFYSVPDRPNSELFALLGIETASDSSTNQSGMQLLVSGANLAGNYLLNPISMTIRKTFGLDMFVIRTGFLGNVVQNIGMTNSDPLSLIEGTSITMGKYLFSNLFLEYELALSRNPNSTTMELQYLHTLGLGWDFRNVFVGYEFAPYTEEGNDLSHEHRVELNLHQTF